MRFTVIRTKRAKQTMPVTFLPSLHTNAYCREEPKPFLKLGPFGLRKVKVAIAFSCAEEDQAGLYLTDFNSKLSVSIKSSGFLHEEKLHYYI